MKKFLTTLSLSLMSLMLFSQTYDQKFGKVSMAEMEMKVCPIDSSAEAVVLFDLGETRFEYNTSRNRFQLNISRHVRIKIFSKEGLEQANIKLILFEEKDLEERMHSFKGFTYNVVDGKIEKEKVGKEAIFREKVDNVSTAVKISFPKVVEGSVIEYEYAMSSDYIYNLQPWAFQTNIPVLYSEYIVGIPEYYQYNTKVSGYEQVNLSESSSDKSVVFTGFERSGGSNWQASRSASYRDVVTYKEKAKTFIAKNLPAMGNEAYVDNINNYLTKVNFELSLVKYPNEIPRIYALTWEDINKKLLERTDFGKQLDNGGYMSDDLKSYVGNVEKAEEKLLKIILFVKSKVKWDEKYRLYSDDGVKTAYKKGIGNSSDVNLNLIVALREMGFNAYPVVLSTRSHGQVFEWQRTVSGFNHVIACVVDGDKNILLDATSLVNVYGLLPLECLNGQARLIDKVNGKWIDLNAQTLSKKVVYANLKIDNNLQLVGKVESTYKDYFAQSILQDVRNDDSLKGRKEDLVKQFVNASIDSLSISTPDNTIALSKESFKIKIDNISTTGEDIVYLSPLAGFCLDKNPFVTTERKFPVNFTFPHEETLILKYKLPVNYRVEEMPSKISFSMPDDKGRFVYSCQNIGDEIVVTSKLTIPQTIYVSTDYPALRGFIDEVIKKQNEKVVLKKI